MLVIRKVEEKDSASLVELAQYFYDSTVFSDIIKFDAISLLETIFSSIDQPWFNCWVAELDDKIIGAIAGYAYPFQFNRSELVVMELFWYVKEGYRKHGAGNLLRKQLEHWGKEIKAIAIQMGYTTSPDSERVEKIYRHIGFVENGKTFIKGLKNGI